MLLQPIEIFFSARRIYYKQELVRRSSVDDEVIDDSAIFVEEERVLALTDLEAFDVIRQHSVEPLARILAGRDELAHVRNVEDAEIFPHRLMLVHNACVLDRHEPAAEWN